MKQPKIAIFSFDIHNYPTFRSSIIDLYLDAFTTGEYAQYIARDKAEKTMDEMLRIGFGYLAFTENRLAGAIIGMPLSGDADFQSERHPEIPLNQSLYIAEVMVATDCRGQGIAKQLIDRFLQSAVENEYKHIVIRVWKENLPALSLYKRLGFQPMPMEIVQTKQQNARETFEMKKIYLTIETQCFAFKSETRNQ